MENSGKYKNQLGRRSGFLGNPDDLCGDTDGRVKGRAEVGIGIQN